LGTGLAPPTDSTRPSLICTALPQKTRAGAGTSFPVRVTGS